MEQKKICFALHCELLKALFREPKDVAVLGRLHLGVTYFQAALNLGFLSLDWLSLMNSSRNGLCCVPLTASQPLLVRRAGLTDVLQLPG